MKLKIMKKQGLRIAIISLLVISQFIPLMSQTATKLSVLDTRNVNTGPNGFSSEAKVEFKSRSVIGVPGTGTYSGLLTIAPWTIDNSGNKHHQLNFNDGGIYYRTGLPQDATWGTWTKLIIEDVNGKVGIGGNLGVGTQTPNSKIEVKSVHTYNQDDEIRIGSYFNNNFHGLGLNYRINSVGNPSKHLIEYSSGIRYDLMTFANGKIGIGTSNPTKNLQVSGDPGHLAYLTTTNGTISESASILFQGGRGVVGYDGIFQGMRISTADNTKPIVFTNSLTDGAGELMRINGNGNVGIGISTPAYKLDVAAGDMRVSNYSPTICLQRNTSSGGFIQGIQTKLADGTDHWYFGVLNNNWVVSKGNFENTKLTILDDGRVGIGTSVIPSDYKLAVAGKIIAEEVMVKLQSAGWPDYVFEPDYNLMPLHNVEQFVRTNKHLPGIPSATEVKKDGLSMGDMQNKLLQKIEELTLYMIEQGKTINQQSAKIKELEEKLR